MGRAAVTCHWPVEFSVALGPSLTDLPAPQTHREKSHELGFWCTVESGFADLRLTCSVPLLHCLELQLFTCWPQEHWAQVGICDLQPAYTGGMKKMEPASS